MDMNKAEINNDELSFGLSLHSLRNVCKIIMYWDSWIVN